MIHGLRLWSALSRISSVDMLTTAAQRSAVAAP